MWSATILQQDLKKKGYDMASRKRYAWEGGFIDGMSSLVCFGPGPRRYICRSDSEAIAGDWGMTVNDMSQAFKTISDQKQLNNTSGDAR